MNSPFLFRNKAATLANLDGRLTTARVLPQVTVTSEDWGKDRARQLDRVLACPWTIAADGGESALIVRSCAPDEDGASGSLAGRYTSIQGAAGRVAIAAAVDAVLQSYGPGVEGEVLIQPMVDRPVASGVATSREIGTGRPYYVVSTSDGADTTIITGGRSAGARVRYHFRGAHALPHGRDGAVIRMVQEIEAVTHESSLDVEFAFVEGDATPVLLQARPLVGCPPASTARGRHAEQLGAASEKVRAILAPHPLARGKRSVLGCMTDWNPAEMIGVRPKPLALSLYRSLVTDAVWADQRQAYGYRDLGGFPLLVDILGSPFIDVRASFESFIPAALPDAAAERLVDRYMDRLLADVSLHDKVEFEIVLSCYAFDIDARLRDLVAEGLPRADADALRVSLHALTGRLMDRAGPRRADRLALDQLQMRRRLILDAQMSPLAEAYWLLEDCRRFGTRPFAGLARSGFVAMELLNTLRAVGVISDDDRRDFLMSVSTVTLRMQRDLHVLPRESFLQRYGHLRPGAYDILSPRYDEAPELYFGTALGRGGSHAEARPSESGAELRGRLAKAVAPVLRQHNFDIDPAAFLDFLGDGLREREEAKFQFTRNLSDALARLKAWGRTVGLSPEELAFGDAGVINHCYGSTRDPVACFCDAIREGQESYAVTEATCLPPILLAPEDVWSFAVPAASPTFVTDRRAHGPVVADLDRDRLAGAIVLIPSADPGYDWIFAHDIVGLITAYGGANSHMAIRAAELDLPAVIGVGERSFGEWARARAVSVDCANRRVDPVLV